ncbi:MAG: cytochrome c family protein, partial [Pseudomonadota bacterium]|nr:cytochrome c family protein [Pseudomonadota bacterium]
MDELGFNKLFAGVLLAGLVLMAGVKFADVLVPHTDLVENAYAIKVPETTAVAGTAPVEVGPEPILALLADANPAAGEKVAKKCTACHVFAADGANKVGPVLWGVV